MPDRVGGDLVDRDHEIVGRLRRHAGPHGPGHRRRRTRGRSVEVKDISCGSGHAGRHAPRARGGEPSFTPPPTLEAASDATFMPTRGSLPRFRADIPSGANWLRGIRRRGWTGEPAIPARYRKLRAARHPRPGVNVTTGADSGADWHGGAGPARRRGPPEPTQSVSTPREGGTRIGHGIS